MAQVEITPRERLARCILGDPVDRVPFMTLWGPWQATTQRWQSEGMDKEKDWWDLFGFDPIPTFIPVELGIWPYFETVTLEDAGETFIHLNEYGVVVRDRKSRDSMPQFLEHPVRDRKTWEKFKSERLDPDAPLRFPDNWADLVKDYADRDYPLIIGDYPCGFFGMARWLLGDVQHLIVAADEPEFLLEINEHLCGLWYSLWDRILSEVKPDITFFWEDMAGRQGSMISPAMFRRFMTPFYREMIGLARKHGIKVVSVDTDGFIEDLAPLFEEAGVNCIWPWEVQAGNDLERMRTRCPEMAFMGGMDKRAMAQGREAINAEMRRIEKLLPVGRFIPFPDHLIPPDISWDNYRYFVERWCELIYS